VPHVDDYLSDEYFEEDAEQMFDSGFDEERED